MICPNCNRDIDFLEICHNNEEEEKVAYNCANEKCSVGIVYIVKFKSESYSYRGEVPS